MSGPRLGLAASGADAAETVRLAVLAEQQNLDLILVGNHAGGMPNGDDTYVVTAAAAAATRTRHLRIAVALDLRGSASPLRAAEDLGVLDVLSGGRLELLLRPGADASWEADLDAVFGAWSGWPLAGEGNRSMPVTPAPVQPQIPTWLLEGSDPPVGRSRWGGAGILVLPYPGGVPDGIPGGVPGGIPDGIPGGVPDAPRLHELRRTRDEAGAGTVLFDLAGTPADLRAAAVKTLGTVVGPCLRCAEREVDILALDTADWLLHRTELHHPPMSDID